MDQTWNRKNRLQRWFSGANGEALSALYKRAAKRRSSGTNQLWAEGQTDASIRWVAGNDGFAMLLTGLSYLSESWAEGFDPALMSSGDFITGWGDTIRVNFMHRTGRVDYYETQGCRDIRLNYGSADQNGLFMYLLLSDHIVDLDALLRRSDLSKNAGRPPHSQI